MSVEHYRCLMFTHRSTDTWLSQVTIYQQMAVQFLAGKQADSSCLYNLRHQSKSPVSSIHHNSPSHRKVSRKAHLSAYQLLQGKKPIISVDTIFPLEIHGYIFLKNLDKQALYYFKKDC